MILRFMVLLIKLSYYLILSAVKVRINLPNGDMVGHTGDIEATIVACKAADEAVKVWTVIFKFIVYIFPFFIITNI